MPLNLTYQRVQSPFFLKKLHVYHSMTNKKNKKSIETQGQKTITSPQWYTKLNACVESDIGETIRNFEVCKFEHEDPLHNSHSAFVKKMFYLIPKREWNVDDKGTVPIVN